MEILVLVLSLGLFVAIIVWAVRYTKKINRRKDEMYKKFAERYGLQHMTSKYMLVMLNQMKGQIDGMDVDIYEKMEGSGKNKQVVTRVKITNTPFDFDFKIGKEHLFSKAGKLMGFQDIEFNDEEFDKKFRLKSKQEDKFRSLMNVNMQNELKQLEKDLAATIHHDNHVMSYSNYGPLTKEDQFESFERVVKFMLKLTQQKVY